MLIIQWLNRLPDTDRIVVAKKTATNCGSADEANAEAFRLWPDIRTAQDHRPDGFQVVDQDGRSIQLAKFVIEGAPSA